MSRLEFPVYVAALVILGAVLLFEGQTNSSLKERASLTPKELYAQLANPQLKVQIIDTRPADDDNFNDSHIPGAIPFPGCDEGQLPAAAKDRVYPYVQTVVVSADGDPSEFAKCQAKFGLVRNLAGGMSAWSGSNLPEDTGEYTPPKAGAGGGCL